MHILMIQYLLVFTTNLENNDCRSSLQGSQDGTRQSFEANNDVPPGFERIPALPKKPEKPITFSRGMFQSSSM